MKTTALTLAVILVGVVSAQQEGHSSDVKNLQAWCPLDNRLTGLNLEYCNEEKGATESGQLLEASELHAKRLLFGGEKPEEECGLCSFLTHENKCGLTKKGFGVPFEMAIRKETFAAVRRWCLLGKANMEVCRSFGSTGAGKDARVQMCKDLKLNKYQLDGLRALEFNTGQGETIADIVSTLGQEKTYQLLGLGGCLELLEKNVVLRHIFKKLRPDACAVVCVRALDNPDKNVVDVAAEVYKGFVNAGAKVLAHHQAEYNKTKIVKVLHNEGNLLKSLTQRQNEYTGNLTRYDKAVKVKTALAEQLSANATYEREQMEKYLKESEEYRKRYAEFKKVKNGRTRLPEAGSETKNHDLHLRRQEGTGNITLSSGVGGDDRKITANKLTSEGKKNAPATDEEKAQIADKKNATEPCIINCTKPIAIAREKLRKELYSEFEAEKKNLITKMENEKRDAVRSESLKVAQYEDAFHREINKTKLWTPITSLLKSQ